MSISSDNSIGILDDGFIDVFDFTNLDGKIKIKTGGFFNMGKNKKKKLKSVAKNVMFTLDNGKIKIEKGQKIDLRPFVKDSIDNSVVSRLDGIISKEDVVIDTDNCRVDIKTQMISELFTAEINSKVNNNKTFTIVIPISKKRSLNCFDLLDDTILGAVLRTSTLAPIYSSIKEKWVELNEDDTTNFTNVMYVPEVMEFIDFNTGKIRKKNFFKINILLIAFPNKDNMSENGMEEISDTDATSRIIADICDAAIKCGCKDVIINPYSHKILSKDKHETSRLWKQISTSQRFIENIDSMTFSIEDEDDYIIFSTANESII